MQTDASAMPIDSPGSGLAWHILHFSFMAMCCLWLNGMGCAGGGGGADAWRRCRGLKQQIQQEDHRFPLRICSAM